jgi:hypothetical protein
MIRFGALSMEAREQSRPSAAFPAGVEDFCCIASSSRL